MIQKQLQELNSLQRLEAAVMPLQDTVREQEIYLEQLLKTRRAKRSTGNCKAQFEFEEEVGQTRARAEQLYTQLKEERMRWAEADRARKEAESRLEGAFKLLEQQRSECRQKEEGLMLLVEAIREQKSSLKSMEEELLGLQEERNVLQEKMEELSHSDRLDQQNNGRLLEGMEQAKVQNSQLLLEFKARSDFRSLLEEQLLSLNAMAEEAKDKRLKGSLVQERSRLEVQELGEQLRREQLEIGRLQDLAAQAKELSLGQEEQERVLQEGRQAVSGRVGKLREQLRRLQEGVRGRQTQAEEWHKFSQWLRSLR